MGRVVRDFIVYVGEVAVALVFISVAAIYFIGSYLQRRHR